MAHFTCRPKFVAPGQGSIDLGLGTWSPRGRPLGALTRSGQSLTALQCPGLYEMVLVGILKGSQGVLEGKKLRGQTGL